MRTISLFILAMAGFLASGEARALYYMGGGVYCNSKSVRVGEITYTSIYGCFPSTGGGGGGGGGEAGSFPENAGGSGTTPNDSESIVDTPENPDSPTATRCSVRAP